MPRATDRGAARAVRPDAARAGRGRRGSVGGGVADRARVRRPAARRGRPAQRGGPLPLLDDGGDRRRPGHAAARLPRRDRELAARLQHRHDRAHRQRLPGPRGAHRRQPAVEPARGDGHRPLPARAPPPGRRRRWPATCTRRVWRCWASTTCPAPSRSRPSSCRARCACCSARRAPGLSAEARAACDGTFSIAQFGSTRSINASAAAAIAMHTWVRQHADLDASWRG